MKYAILRVLDDPYIYDDEVAFMERTFGTEHEAIIYLQDELIPYTKQEYAKDFTPGYRADTAVSEDRRKYIVTLYPEEGGDYVHETRFEIIELFDGTDIISTEDTGKTVQRQDATISKRTEEDIKREAILEFLSELKKHCITSETVDSYGETVEPLMYTWFDDDINKLLKEKFGIVVED